MESTLATMETISAIILATMEIILGIILATMETTLATIMKSIQLTISAIILATMETTLATILGSQAPGPRRTHSDPQTIRGRRTTSTINRNPRGRDPRNRLQRPSPKTPVRLPTS
jgi:hypothetical protein